jgi:hypothetical protein
MLSRHPVAIRNLRVCYTLEDIPHGQLNCSRCPRCVRTTLELLCVGALDEAESFSRAPLSPESLASSEIDQEFVLGFYEELVDPPRERGRPDLALTVERCLRAGRARISRSRGLLGMANRGFRAARRSASRALRIH